jgi:hypothetical protein
MCRDKDMGETLAILGGAASRTVFTKVRNPRAMEAGGLALDELQQVDAERVGRLVEEAHRDVGRSGLVGGVDARLDAGPARGFLRRHAGDLPDAADALRDRLDLFRHGSILRCASG